MDVSLQKSLTPNDRDSLFAWSPQVFPVEGRDMEWAALAWHAVAWKNSVAIGHIGFDRFIVTDGGRAVPVIGVGGVVVRPEVQKRGIPARLFEAMHAEAPSMLDADTFTLFCPERLVAYYERHGYRRVNRALTIVQKGRAVSTTFVFMARGNGLSLSGAPLAIDSIPW